MRWSHGYLLLWILCGSLLVRDLIPLLPTFFFVLPTAVEWEALLGYIVSLALLGAILPGKVHLGSPLADGTRLKYKCNGLLIIGALISVLAAASWNGNIDGAWVADHYIPLFIAANMFSVMLSVYLFVKGRLSRPPNWLRSRSIIDDFVMGAELNPFIFGLNVKFFSYRPAMAGWLLVNLSFLVKQFDQLGFITSRMLLYQMATAWYIFDYFVHEPKMLSTWDIIAEHFGFMLVWGEYVFMIFAFSIQNFFLLNDMRPMRYAEVISICATFCLGFTIFRGTNSQKHQFKSQPKAPIWGKPPITVGGRLLASGFWGLARHMNYTGDMLLALSFCLPCGFRSCVPYFYFIYLVLLLVHRERRDEVRCSQRYKSLWDEYCLQVPYHMVPFVY